MRRIAVIGLLLSTLAALSTAGILPLLAWTPELLDSATYPWLFAQLFLLYVALELAPRTRRRALLCVGSVAAMATYSPIYALVATAHALLTGLVLRAPVHRALKLLFLVASVVAGVATGAGVFVLGQTFRLFALYHAARVDRFRPIPLVDVFLYLHFAPTYVVIPYMLCIPRVDRFRRSLDEPTPPRPMLLVWGAALSCVTAFVFARWDPTVALGCAALTGDYLRAAALALPSYPVQAVLVSLGPALILTGLVNLFGIDVQPPFDRPLAATSMVEWWRRWNTHFRDLLVDLFFYPVLLGRLRRRRTLATVLAVAAVFVAGSTLFHLPKQALLGTSWLDLHFGILVENTLAGAIVAVALLRRTPPKVTRRSLAILATMTLVFVTNRAGYLTDFALRGIRNNSPIKENRCRPSEPPSAPISPPSPVT